MKIRCQKGGGTRVHKCLFWQKKMFAIDLFYYLIKKGKYKIVRQKTMYLTITNI